MSDAGRVSGSDSIAVQVTESEGIFIGGWDVGGTAKGAVRALSAVARVVTKVGIWLGIFSPVILVIAGIAYFANRRRPGVNPFGPLRTLWSDPEPPTGGPPAGHR